MAESYPSHQMGDIGNTAEQLPMLHEEDEQPPPPRQLPPMPPNNVGDGYFGMNMMPQQPMMGFNQGFNQGFHQPGLAPPYMGNGMPPFQQPGMGPPQGQQPPPMGQGFNQQPPPMNQGFNQQQPPHFGNQQPMQQPMVGQPMGGQQPMYPMQNQMQQQPMYRQNQFGGPKPPPQNGMPQQNGVQNGRGGSYGGDFDRPAYGNFERSGKFDRDFDGKGKGFGKGQYGKDRGHDRNGSDRRGMKGDRDGKGKGKDFRSDDRPMKGEKGKGKGGKGGKGDKGFGRNHADTLPENCSDLLYDFRVKFRKVELLDIVPHCVEFAKDQYGSRLIQSKLAVCTPDEKQLLYVAIKKEVKHLVLDPFANYVIQKFFEYGTLTQRRGLATELRGNVLELSFHMFGCWVMQRALEFLEGPGNAEQLQLSHELRGEVLRLVGNQNGNHVIQKCIEKMPTDQVEFIIDSFRGEVKRMARHTYGCRVLQRLIEHCVVPQLVDIVSELIDECEELAKDEYGNYVIQSIAERADTPHRDMILQTICEKILDLSTDKYASNVCEKALVYSNDDDRSLLMNTVLGQDGDADPPLLTMMRDRYANYIVQKMIELASPSQKELLRRRLATQIDSLRKFTYGKHIVSTLVRVGIVDRSVLDDIVFDQAEDEENM